MSRGPVIPIPPGRKGTDQPGWTAPGYVPAPVPDGWNQGQRLDGLTVLDCDGQAAVDWWAEHGAFTPYVTESRPGHRAYWYIGEAASGFYHWTLPDGTRGGEVRTGAGKYCVIPPSVHPDTGTEYYWMGPDLFAPVAGPPVPRLPEDKLPPRHGRHRLGESGVTDFLTAEWGERLPNEDCPGSAHAHSGAGDLGLQMRDGLLYARCWVGCDFYEVLDKLVADGRYKRSELWPPVTDPALDAPWVADIAAEEAAAATAPATEFPVDVLPPVVQEIVRRGSRALSCPPEYIGASALAILGAALGRSVSLQMTATWYEHACLWVAIVGKPGESKSPALRPLMAPVWKEQARLREQSKKRQEQEDADAKAQKRKPRHMPAHKVAVSDATMEALHRVLGDNSRGVLMYQDELTGWVRSMGAYKGGLGADRQHWLSIWSGESVTVDRKGESALGLFIEKPFVGIVGGIQPGVLGEISGGREDGLVDRFLFARGTPVPVTEMVWDGLDEVLLDRWASLWGRVRASASLKDIASGHVVRLTDDAKGVWADWYVRVRNEQVPEQLAATWAKMPAQCARLALVLSQIRDVPGDVDGATMRGAIRLAEYFMAQAQLLLAEVGTDTAYDRQFSDRMDRLEAWLRERPEATMRDILRHGPGRWSRKRESLDPVLRALSDSGRVASPREYLVEGMAGGERAVVLQKRRTG